MTQIVEEKIFPHTESEGGVKNRFRLRMERKIMHWRRLIKMIWIYPYRATVP